MADVISAFTRADGENGGAPPDWLPKDRYGFPVVFLESGGVNPNDEHVTYFSKLALGVDGGITLVVCSAVATASVSKRVKNP